MAFSSLAAELELAGEDGFDTPDHLHHEGDVGIGIGIGLGIGRGGGGGGKSLAEEFGMEDHDTLGELEGLNDNYDDGSGGEDDQVDLSSHTPLKTSNGLPYTHTPDQGQGQGQSQSQRRKGKSSTESYYTIPISTLSTPDLNLNADEEKYEDVEEFMVPSMESSPVPPHSSTFGNGTGTGITSKSSRLTAQTSILSLRTKVKAQQMIDSTINSQAQGQGQGQGQDALVVLSETLATTSSFLRDLRAIDSTQTSSGNGLTTTTAAMGKDHTNVEVEDGLQRYLGKMLDTERTREEQLRQLGIIEREMTAIGGWDHEIDTEMELDFPDYLERDEQGHIGWTGEVTHEHENKNEDGKDVQSSIDRQQNLHDIIEDDEMDEINPHDALLSSDDPFSDEDRGTESNRTVTRGSSLLSPPILAITNASMTKTMGTLPRATHQLVSETNSLLHILASLSDTLHTSISMTTSLQRQIRGINSSIQGWRERDESEDKARKMIENWENERVRKGLLGERSTKDLLGEMCLEFEGLLDSYGKRMDVSRRAVIA